MSLDSEYSHRLILDLETAPLPDAADYLEEPTPPSNYVKAEAIAGYIAKAKVEALAKCALDPDLARIVAIGWLPDNQLRIGTVQLMSSEEIEQAALQDFWSAHRAAHFIGYNVTFDLGMLLRRSLYLGVDAPAISLDKYRHPQWTDCMGILSGNDPSKRRSLAFYQKRMKLPALEGEGASVPGWVAAGEWDKVEAHLRADLVITAALAHRLGVWR